MCVCRSIIVQTKLFSNYKLFLIVLGSHNSHQQCQTSEEFVLHETRTYRVSLGYCVKEKFYIGNVRKVFVGIETILGLWINRHCNLCLFVHVGAYFGNIFYSDFWTYFDGIVVCIISEVYSAVCLVNMTVTSTSLLFIAVEVATRNILYLCCFSFFVVHSSYSFLKN